MEPFSEDELGDLCLMFESEGWKIFENIVDDCIDLLDTVDTVSTNDQLHHRKGELAALRRILSLPDTLTAIEDETL